jgi:hypothetical protein
MIVHGYEFLGMVTELLPECLQKIFYENQLTLCLPATSYKPLVRNFTGPRNGCEPAWSRL